MHRGSGGRQAGQAQNANDQGHRTKQGFPRGYKMRQRQVRGLKTGDRVRAVVPAKLKTAGIHVGRVQVRKSGSFSIKTRDKDMDGISASYVHLIQRGDGYEYTVA